MTWFLKKEEYMKTAITIAAMLVLAAISGCQSSGHRGGGMTKDAGSEIAVPTLSTEVKKGEIKPVTSAVSTKADCGCNRPAH